MEHPFKALGVSNKETLMETNKYLVPSFIRPLTTMVSIIFLCQSVYEMLHASPFMSFFFILLSLVVYIIYRHSLISIVNRYMQMMKGYMHTEDMVYQLSFLEDNICLSFSGTDIYTNIPYSDVNKIFETKNLYLMKAKSGTPVIITKGSLSNISKEDLKEFLTKKCINVKKIKLK